MTVTVAAVVLAVLAPGAARTVYALDDGGVWVTNGAASLAGRLNYPSRALDGSVRSRGGDLDIAQQGSQVVLIDRTKGTAAAVDTALVATSTSATLPAGAAVMLGGETLGGEVGVFDAVSGRVWMRPLTSLGLLHPAADTAMKGIGHVLAAAMSAAGTMFTVDRAGRLMRSTPAGATTSMGTLPGFNSVGKAAMTVVGATPVVTDQGGTGLWIGTTRTRAVAKGVALQAPSTAAADVVYATDRALVMQPLDGGASRQRPVSTVVGTPAAPVAVGGCAYGAWSGTARFLRWCGDRAVSPQAIPGLTGTVVFRVNRTRVVLNDPMSGTMWLVDSALKRLNDWSAVDPKSSGTDDKTTKTRRTADQLAVSLPDRKGADNPPKAEDDRLGVRAGSTVVLHVLDNDSDPDGDVLSAKPDADPSAGPVTAVQGGAALQIDVGAAASGTSSFEYTVSDGRGETDRATVQIHVVPRGEDAAPVQSRVPSVAVESGASVTLGVLTDWRDPDGDDLQVVGVQASGSDVARATPDGVVTYGAVGAGTGERDLRVEVGDGRRSSAGRVAVLVRPPGTAAPVANNDRAVTSVGKRITVSPLANDIDPSANPLRLVRAALATSATAADVVPDFTSGTFTFSSAHPGTYYVQYLVAAGPRSATGLVRVDVGPASSKRPPIAMQDTAYLPVSGQISVDPLANDMDPAGGVLVVQSISVPNGVHASVALVGHALVRMTGAGGEATRFAIRYVVANAAGTANGVIHVVPTAPARSLPPVVAADQATVRAGDLVSVDVLANDLSPAGSRLFVVPQLVESPPSSAGRAFVSGDRVRFLASSRTGMVHLVYQATDIDPGSGQVGVRAAGTIAIRVVGKEGANQPPRPQPVVGRVLQGGAAQIAIPVDGIDPDGDSVQLVGVGGARRGVAVLTNGGIAYTAGTGQSGTDEFTYTVEDRLGAMATGSVRVGVAVPATVNQPPRAVADTIRARPGRQVSVDVLLNDVDPDGDSVRLVGASGTADDASASGGRVLVRVPATKGTTAVSYRIEDARGATAIGGLAVVSDPNAPLLPPVARDDQVTPQQIADRRSVSVPVLANDDDPDGIAAQLTPSVVSGSATVAGRRLVVAVQRAPSIVVYTVQDRDGLRSTAVVRVPGRSQLPPVLRRGVAPVQIRAGGSASVVLSRYVVAPSGRPVRVTQADRVFAPGAQSISVQSATTLLYRAAKTEAGPHWISVEVTDGAGPDDPRGLKSSIAIPVEVRPVGDLPPSFAGGSITVAKGEPAATLDLRAASADPNPGDLAKLTYETSTAPGFDARIDGGTLRVSTSSSPGKAGTLVITVSDGQRSTKGTVTLIAAESTRPLAIAVTDVVSDAQAGQTRNIDVLANDSNPFPSTPLRLLDASVVTPGAGTATIGRGSVAVTPRSGFSGTLVARYRVADATGAADRYVEGRILVTVRGVPDAPGVPTVAASESRQVTLSWLAGADNGAPITKYVVTSDRGTSTDCPATTCTITDLSNGTEYRFVVRAVNEVGTSSTSAASAAVTPDTRPDAPDLTSIDYGDGSLTVAWKDGQNLGSAVTEYVVTVSPGQTYAVPAGSTSFTVTGLTNGAQYALSVQAENRSGASDSSAALTESPAGTPGEMNPPDVSSASPIGSQNQITLTWGSAAPNAEALSGYRITVSSGGSPISQIDPGADVHSTTMRLPNATTEYAFVVAGRNKATDSGRSALRFSGSTTYRATGNPGAPSTPTVAAKDGAIGLAWTAGDLNGLTASEATYEYDLDGDGSWRPIDASGGPSSYTATVSSGISNGNQYTVRIRATGLNRAGDPSASSAAVTPYGRPNSPVVSASGNDTSVTLTWAPGATNGRSVASIMVSIDGGAFANRGSGAGSVTTGNAHSETHTIDAYVIDSEGQNSARASASATSAAVPPAATASHGNAVPPGGSFGSGHEKCAANNLNCALVRVSYQNVPSGTYHWQCIDDEGRNGAFASYASDTEAAYAPITIGGSGAVEPGCGYGYTGYHLYVRIYNDSGVDFQTPIITW